MVPPEPLSQHNRIGSDEHLAMLVRAIDPRCWIAVAGVRRRRTKAYRRQPYISVTGTIERCAREQNAPVDQVLGLYGYVRSRSEPDLWAGLDDRQDWTDPTGTPVEAAIRLAEIMQIVWRVRL